MHRSTFFTVFCLAVLAFASAGAPIRRLPRSPAVHPAVAEHLQKIREVMNNVPKLINAQLTSAPASKLPSLASKFAAQANTPCDDAVRNFDRLVKDCNVDDMIEGFKNPGLFVNDTVIQFCQPECVGQLNAQLTYVVSNCTGVVASLETDVADFQDALVVARGACKQDTDGNFCPLVYKNISAISVAFLNESLETSSDVLDMAGCSSSCINDEFTTVTEYATSPIMGTMGYHKLLCSQVDLDDCALIYQNYQRNISAQDQNAQLGTVCSPCFRRFVNGLYQMTNLGPVPIDSEDDSGVSAITPQSLAGVLNRLNYLCAVDEAGQFCVQRFSNETSNNITTACGDIFGSTTTCSAECVSAVNDFKNQNGCCTNTYFEMIRATQNGSITDNAQQAIAFFQNQCNITVASSCAVSTINMTLTLNNIKAEWVQANWPALQQALRKDLSGRTGIPYALVHVDSYEIYTPGAVVPPPADNSTNSTVPTPVSNNSALNGVRAFGQITPQNEDDVQETFAILSTGITDLDLDLATTGVIVPLSARVDPLSPLLLDAAQSSATLNSPQGASTSPAPRSAVLAVTGLVIAGMIQLAFSTSM